MLGIFGGTFDPVHHGHLRIALDVLEALQLDQVRFVPLGQAVHRQQPVASAAQRLRMLELAVAGHPQLQVDAREIVRGGQSYMVDTLRSLRAEFPLQTLCLLLGSDAYQQFAQWREPRVILELAHLVVLQRPQASSPQSHELRVLVEPNLVADVTALHQCQAGGVLHLPVTQLEIASSDIRARLASGRDPAFLLPSVVLAYLQEQRLYR